MINDLFNFKREESKLSYNIYHEHTVRNQSTNNAKNKRGYKKTFPEQRVCKAMITFQINF